MLYSGNKGSAGSRGWSGAGCGWEGGKPSLPPPRGIFGCNSSLNPTSTTLQAACGGADPVLAPSKEPPCQVQGYRIPLAGVNRSRAQQTPVNQDGSCAMQAGGRRLHSQGTTAAGVGKPVRDPRGAEGFPNGEHSPNSTGEALAPGLCVQRDSTARWAVPWYPSQLHGTLWAQHGGQQQCQAACTAPAWHTLHGPPRSNCAAQLGTTGATCLQLGWLCHPKRRGTAAPTLAGERDTPVPSREGVEGGTAVVRNS